MSVPSPLAGKPLAVLLDFDGTLTVRDVAERLLDTFVTEDWRKESEAWRAGVISFRECLRREYAHLQDAKQAEYVRYALETTELRLGAQEFVTFCREKRIPVEIVSGGLDLYITPLLEKFGMDGIPFVAMRADGAVDGHLMADYPVGTPVCDATGCSKCPRLLDYRRRGFAVAYIGDGNSDQCPARRADIVFARDSLARHCAGEGIPFRPFETFGEVLAVLRPYLEQAGRPPARR
ncbi:MAG: MtnX-like HAD-IB family phosphatase [Chloroflexi bacterium]|nr:MtnX-like HAD-IB family phosphatase [Chloroflexota bacterium]